VLFFRVLYNELRGWVIADHDESFRGAFARVWQHFPCWTFQGKNCRDRVCWLVGDRSGALRAFAGWNKDLPFGIDDFGNDGMPHEPVRDGWNDRGRD
jgi:hypothetical protein